MSQFYGFDFIFDNIPSKTYDLKIITFEDGSLFDGVGSSNIKVISQKVLRKSKPYYLGRTQEPVLEFSLMFGSPKIITAMDRNNISRWLFGRASYKKLQILQDDMINAYFNCFLKEPKPLYICGTNYAFECTVLCDSHFAYSYPKVTSGSFAETGIHEQTFYVYNDSAEDEYLYPKLTLKTNLSGSSIDITNVTDGNRVTSFGTEAYPLSQSETVELDNDLQILSSSTGLRRMPSFNKVWFRLLPGKNQINIKGGIDNYKIEFNERLKIGG